MKKGFYYLYAIVLLHASGLSAAFAQNDRPDSAKNTIETYFNKEIRQQSRLFNGIAFQGYAPPMDGSPNFQEINGFVKGDIVYDGFRYNEVLMMYDLNEDAVIVLNYDGYSMLSLISDKVTDFYIKDHHFTYINVADSSKNVPFRTGFFDLIYNGETKVLVKRAKTLQLNVTSSEVRKYFVSKTSYFLEKDHQYYPINGESSFLSFFKDKKVALKKYLRERKIKFRKTPEEAMVLLASYYEQLPN